MPRVEGFEHRPGEHCGSTSLRNLAAYYGWGYDEPTCFGLGAGLGFTYFELPSGPQRAFFGRPVFLELAFFDHLEIGHEHRQGEDWAAISERLRGSIAADDPCMLFTDIYHLPYFGTDTHFAPHSLLAVGYDEDADGVTLSDSEFAEPQRVTADKLRAAVGSDWVVPEPNRSLVVTDPEPGASFAEAAAAAIEETARYMAEPSAVDRDLGPGSHGLAGIRRFADQLPDWTDLEDPGWTARFAYQNVERRGTGGGTFRRLYADFLARAADAVPAVMAAAADRMAAIADDWTAVGMTLKEASEREDRTAMAPLFDEAGEAIHDIADREEQLFADLRAALD